MSMGMISRRCRVLDYLKGLPDEEKGRTSSLVELLNDIEDYTILPLYIAPYFLIFLAGLMLTLIILMTPRGQPTIVDELLRGVPLDRMMFCTGISTIVLIVGLIFVLKKFVFNPKRDATIKKLRALLASAPEEYTDALKKLAEIDPDMARNIKKYIAQALQES